jgi:nitroreductase
VRQYEDRRVPPKELNLILEAGRQAPSADNLQPWHFIVLTNQAVKEKLSQRPYSSFIRDSAFTIVGCGYVGNEDGRQWSTVETSIALQNMVLTAWALGIGSCWIGDFQQREVKELLSIPEDWKVVALVSFGYPAAKPGTRWKKPLSEIVGENKF